VRPFASPGSVSLLGTSECSMSTNSNSANWHLLSQAQVMQPKSLRIGVCDVRLSESASDLCYSVKKKSNRQRISFGCAALVVRASLVQRFGVHHVREAGLTRSLA